MRLELPHPLILLLGGVGIAALLTWVLPAGEYDRRDDEATGRRVVVAGTYHPVDPEPVGPMAAVVALPRGFIEAADVVAVVLFVGGAWVVVDRLGTLVRLVGELVRRFRRRGLWAIPVVSLFFASMCAANRPPNARHPKTSRSFCSCWRRWPRTSTARSRGAGASTSSRPAFSSPA